MTTATTKRGGPSLSSRARTLYQANPEWLQDATLDRAVQALQTMAPRESNDKLRKAISKAKGQLQGKGGRTSRSRNGAGNGAVAGLGRMGLGTGGAGMGTGGIAGTIPGGIIGVIRARDFALLRAEVDLTLVRMQNLDPTELAPEIDLLSRAQQGIAKKAATAGKAGGLVGAGAR